MPRTLITKPFSEWRGTSSASNQYVVRDARHYSGAALTMKVRFLDLEVYRSDTTGALYTGVSLADSIRWVDEYIIDNFQVQKTVEERLADAVEQLEAASKEITNLRARVTELEAA